MDSCLKLVSCALNAILKWVHLHNKQSCEKTQLQSTGFQIQSLFQHSAQSGFRGFRTEFPFNCFPNQRRSCFLSENPMFEICSNGFSHFKLSQNGCKSSSLVNEHENVKIEFQIPVGRVSFFFRKIENIKSLQNFFGYG